MRIKLQTAKIRLLDRFRLAPKRWQRLLSHWQEPKTSHWYEDTLWLTIDLAGFCDVYETLSYFVKWQTRPLTSSEIQLARTVYGNSIDYTKVRIDETALLGPRQYHFCYVSFNTINSWKGMRTDTFIHELMHIWQYQHLGAVYIPRALRAQQTREGYNYGGVTVLRQAQQAGKQLLDFNYEQQADIVADYFCIKKGYRPHWGNGTTADLEVYEYFLQQLYNFQV